MELNSADRDELYDLPGLTYTDVDAIIAYRTAKGRIDDPAELVGAGAITAEQLLQMAPFIRIDAQGAVLPVSGKALAIGAVTATDNLRAAAAARRAGEGAVRSLRRLPDGERAPRGGAGAVRPARSTPSPPPATRTR